MTDDEIKQTANITPGNLRTGPEVTGSSDVTLNGVTELTDIPPVYIPPDSPPIDIPSAIPSFEPTNTITPDCPPEVAACRSVLDSVQDVLSTIESIVVNTISTTLSEIIPTIADCESKAIGQISVKLDSCEEKLSKCQSKAMKPIRDGLGQCYGYLSQCGCCYPTVEQVVYGLDTGDYLGSVGLEVGEHSESTTTQPNQYCPPPPCYTQQPQPQPQEIKITVDCTKDGDGQELPINPPSAQISSPSSEIEQFNLASFTQNITQLTEGLPATVIELVNSISQSVPQDKIEQIVNLFVSSHQPPECPIPAPPPPPPPGEGGEVKIEEMHVPRFDLGKAPNPKDAEEKRVPNWEQESVCELLEQNKEAVSVDRVVGFYINADKKRIAPAWWLRAWGTGNYKDWSWLKKQGEQILWSIIHGAKDILKDGIEEINYAFRCKHIPVDALLINGIMGIVNQWTNGAFEGLVKGFEYKLNQACPQQIPSQADLDSMRLNGTIDAFHWKCLTEANNNLPVLANQALAAKRTKIQFSDALKLHRLKRILPADYLMWAKANGVMTDQDREALERAAIDIPTVSDLIRMMVRDVADPDAVKKYGLNDDFEKKWQGQLAIFGTAQGIDPEIAKMHWAAHWQQPSNTQVMEMFYRLRPDKPEIVKAHEESLAAGGKGVITTKEDFKQLLQINDMLPFWQDRFVQVSFHPLTRTDAQRAHQIGALGATPQENDAKLQSVYQDLGYTSDDAKILVEFAKKQNALRKMRQPIPRQANKEVKRYMKRLLTEEQLRARLQLLNIDKDRLNAIVNEATADRAFQTIEENVDCIRRTYMEGGLDDVQAKAALVNEGIDQGDAIAMVDNWWCKKKLKLRHITAGKLCEWREKKLIDAEQHLRRLVNLGFALDDATKIVKECEMDIGQRQFKAAVAELKREVAMIEKEKKAAEKESKQAFAAARKASRNGTAV